MMNRLAVEPARRQAEKPAWRDKELAAMVRRAVVLVGVLVLFFILTFLLWSN
jgi:hypothetical protein